MEPATPKKAGSRSVVAATVGVQIGFAVESFAVQTMVLGEVVAVNLDSKPAGEPEVSVVVHLAVAFAGNWYFEAASAKVGEARSAEG